MIPDSISLEDVLAENARRLREASAPYDPIAGDPSDPSRIHFGVEEMECHIPKSMLAEPMAGALLHAGSLSAYLRTVCGTDSQEARERELLRWRLIRSRHDFPFWAASSAYIKCKGGGDDVLFRLNRPQRRLVEALEDMRRNGLPIRLVLLKARQWGGSTCVQLYMAWLQLVHQKGLNSLIIAHQGCATDEIKDMFDRMMARYPEVMLLGYDADGLPLLPERLPAPGAEEPVAPGKRLERVGGAGAAFRVMARNCKVKVGSAERPDSCRGGDYNLVHCSEVGLWKATRLKQPEQILQASCSGVLFAPMTMILLESTANGTGNFFHREYEAAKNGKSQFRALFIPWFEIEQYSLPFPSEAERVEFATRLVAGRAAEQADSERAQPGAYLWKLWNAGASLEAIHWYVMERAKYSDHGMMAAEYPSDDVEAFVHSGARVFDRYRVEDLRAGCRPPILRGEIDGDRPSGPESLRNVRFNADQTGGLLIWRDRDRADGVRVAGRYLAVVDIGGRSDMADWSVITVFDRVEMTVGGLPEVAAQWRGHTDFDLLAWNAARIATYFDSALLVIESNTLETHDPGRMEEADQSNYILCQIRDAYPNLYARRRSEQDVRMGNPVKWGFHTNAATKPMVISSLVMAIREGLYVERDENCLAEYLAYEQRPNGSYGALPGYHDDLLMTRAIGLHICFNEMEPPRLRSAASGRRGPDRPVSAAVW